MINSVMVAVFVLLEPEAAPFAGGRCPLLLSVELYVLNGMSKTEFIDASAAGSVSVNLYNRQVVHELLSISFVALD